MENTGERHIVGNEFIDEADFYIHLLHIASYEYVLKFTSNKKVLDYGCGSGYGTKLIANNAEYIVGVDISKEAIVYAKDNFFAENLIYKEIDQLEIQKFDIIISFQVIEHVENDKKYISMLKSLLNPGGILFLSTPDKSNRLFKYIQNPWNQYHLKEYSDQSITRLLNKYFTNFEVLKISSIEQLVLPEINRRKKQRLITLPCTLAFYPKFVRIFLLKFEKKIFKLITTLLKKNIIASQPEIQTTNPNFHKFTTKDIEISKSSQYPTDLFVICYFDA